METFDDVLRQWRDAEARGDTAALDLLLDPEFRGDGPCGFVVGKQQWLDRYRLGELAYEAFGWKTIQVRVNGDTAVGIAVQSQVALYRGEDYSGDFLCTLVAVRRD
jgi:Domain of unknown function (DUF4440)